MTESDKSLSDETLMAYADGELEPARCAEVEAAMAVDPEIARRVEQHRALRKKLGATYDPVLLETLPERLVSAAHAQSAGQPQKAHREATVTDLRRVRAAKAAEAKGAAASARRAQTPSRPWTWVEWGSMAASVAVGAVIAMLAMKSPSIDRIGTQGGQLVAQGDLAQALSNQLASDQPASGPVQIGVSFRTRAGDHCRTFVLREQNPLGGLACRQAGAWRMQVLANTTPPAAAPGGYQPASAAMPTAVLTAVETQIDGDPLDAPAEAAARDRGWQ